MWKTGAAFKDLHSMFKEPQRAVTGIQNLLANQFRGRACGSDMHFPVGSSKETGMTLPHWTDGLLPAASTACKTRHVLNLHRLLQEFSRRITGAYSSSTEQKKLFDSEDTFFQDTFAKFCHCSSRRH